MIVSNFYCGGTRTLTHIKQWQPLLHPGQELELEEQAVREAREEPQVQPVVEAAGAASIIVKYGQTDEVKAPTGGATLSSAMPPVPSITST